MLPSTARLATPPELVESCSVSFKSARLMRRDGAELLVGSFDTVGNYEGNDDILGVADRRLSAGNSVKRTPGVKHVLTSSRFFVDVK